MNLPARRRLRTAICLLAGALCAAGIAHAQSQDQGALRFNGFGTVGLTHTRAPDGWGFRRDISQPPNGGGTREDIDTRLGLQANYQPTTQLEFVAQVLLKRRVATSPPIDSLEWAFASYRLTPEWTLRVGRTNPDAFLLSDYRNVGFAYPWVRPEIGFYGALPVYSIDGADVTRSWSDGVGHWKVKLFSGEGAAYGTAFQGQPAVKLHAHNVSGLTVSREADGLTLRATALHARAVLGHSAGDALSAGLEQVQSLPIPSIAAEAQALQHNMGLQPGELTFVELGASYESGGWLLSGELSNISGNFVTNHVTAGYASAGRRFGDLTLFGVLAASRSTGADQPTPEWAAVAAPVLGPAAAQQIQLLGSSAAFAINAQRQKQRSVSLGLRWDFHPQMAFKLQWDHYHVDANGHLLWANATPDAGNADVGTVLLDFVF